MSTDFAAKEREFLDALKPDTGRDLSAWMEAISAQHLADKNDVIDWLRQQGFTFSRASWLERIHHNGGKPIYFDAEALPPEADAPLPPPAREPATAAAPRPVAAPRPPATRPAPTPPPPAAAPHASGAPPGVTLDEVLAKAKAYRPLANLVLAEIAKGRPHLSTVPQTGHLELSNPGLFAVLTISPKELRLVLDLGDVPFTAPLEKAKNPNPTIRLAPRFSHMMVLDDARQVTPELLRLVEQSERRSNS